MYAALASSAAPGVAGKDDKKLPNLPWTCPVCTFELTPPNKKKCGVCDAPRPGMENEQDEEEEELPVEAPASKKVARIEPDKKAQAHLDRRPQAQPQRVAQPAAKPSISPVVNQPSGKPIALGSAKLLLVAGSAMATHVPIIASKLGAVTNIATFDIDGNVEHVKQARDAITSRLRVGKSCIVFDSSISAERQSAWMKLAVRCNASCDLAVSLPSQILQSGFGATYFLPLPYDLMRTRYTTEQTFATPKLTPVSASSNSAPGTSASASAASTKANGVPAKFAPTSTPTPKKVEILDLTMDDD
jgi:hypothetical protein